MKPDDKVPLTRALKQHYSTHQLSDHQLDALAALEARSKNKAVSTALWERAYSQLRRLKTSPYRLIPALAFVLAVFIVIPLMSGKELTEQVINEIAYNHNKQVVMEVQSSQLDTVTGYLSQLGFSLIQSRHLPDKQWELLGGRYCSIQGKLAAQLKLRNRSDNRIYTFYQALLPEPMTDFKHSEAYVDGIKVSVWQENNLLLGLAGQPVH